MSKDLINIIKDGCTHVEDVTLTIDPMMETDVETFNRIKVALSLHGIEVNRTGDRILSTGWANALGVKSASSGVFALQRGVEILLLVHAGEVVLMKTILCARDGFVNPCRKILAAAKSMVEECGVQVAYVTLVHKTTQGDLVCQLT